MELDIRPEPTEEERAAICAAVEKVRSEDHPAASDSWWLAGLPGDDSEDAEDRA